MTQFNWCITYKCHKVNFRRGGSYTNSPDWIKKKKATINLENKDDKCFQYAVTVTLNYGKIESHLERVSITKPFINKHFVYLRKRNVQLISQKSSICQKQIMLWMIPNKEKEGWHYFAVKELSGLLHGITSKHRGNFIAWIAFILLEQKINKLKSHEKVCKNKDFWNCNAIRKG